MVGRVHRLHLHRHADDRGVRWHAAGHAGQNDLPAVQMGRQPDLRTTQRQHAAQPRAQGHPVRPRPTSVQLRGCCVLRKQAALVRKVLPVSGAAAHADLPSM